MQGLDNQSISPWDLDCESQLFGRQSENPSHFSKVGVGCLGEGTLVPMGGRTSKIPGPSQFAIRWKPSTDFPLCSE